MMPPAFRRIIERLRNGTLVAPAEAVLLADVDDEEHGCLPGPKCATCQISSSNSQPAACASIFLPGGVVQLDSCLQIDHGGSFLRLSAVLLKMAQAL